MPYYQETYNQLRTKYTQLNGEFINMQQENIQLKEQVDKLESSISRFRTNNIRMSKQNASLKASNVRLTNKVNKLKDTPAVEEWKQKNERLREQVKYWKGNKAIKDATLVQDQNLLRILTDEKMKVLHQVEKITKLRKIIVKLIKRIDEHKLMDQDATQAILSI